MKTLILALLVSLPAFSKPPQKVQGADPSKFFFIQQIEELKQENSELLQQIVKQREEFETLKNATTTSYTVTCDCYQWWNGYNIGNIIGSGPSYGDGYEKAKAKCTGDYFAPRNCKLIEPKCI